MTAGPRIVTMLLALTILLSGCGAKGHSGMNTGIDTSLTATAARTQMVAHLNETLRALPASVHFSLLSDDPTFNTQGVRTALLLGPCGLDTHPADAPRAPQSILMLYWVNGIPQGQAVQYFNRIKQVWADLGWKVTDDNRQAWQEVITPDGYKLDVRNTTALDNGLISVGVYSPCFHATDADDQLTQPTEIKHA